MDPTYGSRRIQQQLCRTRNILTIDSSMVNQVVNLRITSPFERKSMGIPCLFAEFACYLRSNYADGHPAHLRQEEHPGLVVRNPHRLRRHAPLRRIDRRAPQDLKVSAHESRRSLRPHDERPSPIPRRAHDVKRDRERGGICCVASMNVCSFRLFPEADNRETTPFVDTSAFPVTYVVKPTSGPE